MTGDEITGAGINAFEGVGRKVVAIQATGPELLKPSAFDCDDCLTRPQKTFDVSKCGLRSSVIRHPRAFTRNEVVTKVIRIDGPDYVAVRLFGPSRLEQLN